MTDFEHKSDGSDKVQIQASDKEEKKILLPKTISESDLLATQYADPIWIVPGILPEGLTILAGKPKAGKTTLALSLGNSASRGGKFLGQMEVEKREVLYLALEDTPRRLQVRFASILNGSVPTTNQLHFGFVWPRTDDTAIKMFDDWFKVHPNTKLIVIDTLARIRGKRSGWSLYESDYEEISRLKEIADQHSAAFVVLHHLRKAGSEDILDLVSGSTGLTAAADTVAIMKRGSGRMDAKLHIRGRDVDDIDLALKFDSPTKSFSILGQVDECDMSEERLEILDFLKNHAGKPVQLKDIAEELGKKETTVSKLLSGLIESGLVEKPNYGKYQVKNERYTGETGGSGESGAGDENPSVATIH